LIDDASNESAVIAATSLSLESNADLLSRWAAIMSELGRRGILRTANNPVADYAEYVVADRLGLTLENNSNAGHDGTDKNGVRYQIKARRLTANTGRRQLSPIRNIDQDKFDFLIVALFDHDFTLVELWKLPIALVRMHGRHSNHVNGWIVHAKGAILLDSRAERLV